MLEDLIKLIQENPTLPVVPMVDYEVCAGDEYGRWMGSIGSVRIGEFAIYDERYFDERPDFTEAYYDRNDDELDERFGIEPMMSEYDFEKGRCTKEQYEANLQNEKALDEYLAKVADRYFVKAILVNIDLPDDDLFDGADKNGGSQNDR